MTQHPEFIVKHALILDYNLLTVKVGACQQCCSRAPLGAMCPYMSGDPMVLELAEKSGWQMGR